MSAVFVAHVPAIYLPGEPDPEGIDVLVTRWDDGTQEVAVRPGGEQRWVTWSPPVALVEES